MNDPSVIRYLGGRKFTLCLVFLLALFVLALRETISGTEFLTGGLAAIGANTGGNLLQEWWDRAKAIVK